MKRIDKIWAAVSLDEKDNIEGVCAAPLGPYGLVPLIAADEDRLSYVMEQGEMVAKMFKMKVTIIELHNRTDLKTFDYSGDDDVRH